MVQAQRPDLVIVDRTVHGRHRIALVKLTCPWDTDAKRAEECKAARYADLKEEMSNQGWDCRLYLIKVGARSTELHCQVGKGPLSVFILDLGPRKS
jgi:hypothetical protein